MVRQLGGGMVGGKSSSQLAARSERTGSRWRHISARCAVSLGAVLLSSTLGIAHALAGEYVMRTCDVPGHPNALLGPWQEVISDSPRDVILVDSCASGGGAGFALAGPRRITVRSGGSLRLVRPSTGPQSVIALVKARIRYAARLGASGSPLFVRVLEHGSAAAPYVRDLAASGEDLVYEHDFNPTRGNQFNFAVLCGPDGAYVADCVPDHTVPLWIRGMEVTLSEDVQPIVPQIGGPLIAQGPQSGLQTVTYSAFDHQSGLTRIEAVLDDSVVATRDLSGRCSYDDFTVCPSVDEGSLSVDTRAVPNGRHRLTVRVYDAAGNVTSTPSSGEIQVENAPPPAIAPNLRLAARFNNSPRASLIVPWGRRVTLRGSLTTESKQGIAGAEVNVLERAARAGALELAAGRAQTGPSGDFKHVLQSRRPSRSIRLVHQAIGAASAVSRTLRLRVRAAATLRASLRGVTVRYAGRVLSRPLPTGGKRIVLQGKAPGFAWAPFARLRTNGKGTFAGTYRLPVRRPGVVLKIRAVVPAQRGYPYLSYRGRPVALRVR